MAGMRSEDDGVASASDTTSSPWGAALEAAGCLGVPKQRLCGVYVAPAPLKVPNCIYNEIET